MSEPKTAAAPAPKWVYFFSAGHAEGNARMKELLGGKGANLAEMAGLGLPVPPGFTITTEVCTTYYANGRQLPAGSRPAGLRKPWLDVGRETGHVFGDENNPLLVSVRSGSRASMPGMMDTILNLGLNSKTVAGLAKRTGDERFAYDSYRRFIQMYGSCRARHRSRPVRGHSRQLQEPERRRLRHGPHGRRLARGHRSSTSRKSSATSASPSPEDTKEQLWGAISAVFGSWLNARAITYRRLHAIPDNWGTAVNVQAMVFGNMGNTSATGVAFTRNPSTGGNEFYGEFLLNAQGEDVVAGIRTPQALTETARIEAGDTYLSLEALMPDTFRELRTIFSTLERRYRDMQDIEFTIENGKVWMLQTRTGKRTGEAAIKIAVDLANEGIIDREEGRPPRRSRRANAAPTPDHRPERREGPADTGTAGISRRRFRRDRVLFRRRRADQKPGPQGHPRAHRDLARRTSTVCTPRPAF